MLGEKSVKCRHPKSRCPQNPQKWFILLGNDSDFGFSNLQSAFGRAWRNPWNNILCFKNITFAQPSLHEKKWTCPVVICQLSYKSGEAPKTSRDWHTPTCGSDCPVPGLNLAGSTGELLQKFRWRDGSFPPRNQVTWWWSNLTNQLIWFIPIICRFSTIFSVVLGLKHHCEPPSHGLVVHSQEPGGSAPRLQKKTAETPG